MKLEIRFLPGDESTRTKFREWKDRFGNSEGDRQRLSQYYLLEMAKIVSVQIGKKGRISFKPVEVTGGSFFSGTAVKDRGLLKITIQDIASRH